MDDWGDDEFCVDLDQENSDPHSDLGQPCSKRHNAGATPERFRGCQPASAESGGRAAAAAAAAAPPVAAQQQPLPSSGGGGGSVAGSGQHKQSQSSWSVRSIFMSGRSAAPTPPPSVLPQPGAGQQLSGRQPPPAAPVGLRAVAAAAPRSPGLHPLGSPYNDDLPGPLTQMAAANTCVAAAFCPHCGCFLADLGSTQQQAAHTAACAATAEQQQHAAAERSSGRDGADGGGGDGEGKQAEEAEEEEDSDEQNGNWSEQEEASQAAAECGVAAAAVAAAAAVEAVEDEEAHGGAAGSEDHGQGDDGPWVVGEAGRADEEAAAAAAAAAGAQQEQAALHAWLEQRGLSKYAEHFARAGAHGGLEGAGGRGWCRGSWSGWKSGCRLWRYLLLWASCPLPHK